MTVYSWLCLFGIPSFISALVAWMVKEWHAIKALRLGMQAMLRDRLLQVYAECKRNGSASFVDRENFENLYKQYHALGANGVMDDVRTKFLNLPLGE